MSGDRKLPAVRPNKSEAAQQLERTARALEISNPISGFFHNVRKRASTHALNSDTENKQALTKNMDAHEGVLHSMMRVRDALDVYQARDELAGEHYENAVEHQRAALRGDAHKRDLEAKRHKQEQHDADRGIFNAEQGIAKQRDLRGIHEDRWRAEAETHRDKHRINAAEHRVALEEDVEGEVADQTSQLDRQIDALYEELEQRLADGKDTIGHREAIGALERLRRPNENPD
jgi:hypothetical protein